MKIHTTLKSYFFTLMLLLAGNLCYAQEDEPVEGGTLPGVTITEAEARNIMKGLFDFTRFSHTMAIGKIARDERLTTFTDGFVQRNNIEVLTIGYIDSDHFWPRVFREQRLAKIEKAPTDNLLAAKIIFMPDETDDGTVNGYNITLELTGKSQQVYDLLQVSREEIDSIASQTSQQQLGTPYATPSEAKETVVNALIAALQQLEAKASPPDHAVAVAAFQRDPDQEYGFDAPAHSALQADYPATPIAGQTVRASWKSLESNVPDQVIAIDRAAQALTFEHNGVPVVATAGPNSNSYKLTLTGASDGTQGELLALAGNQTVGVLQTISYSKKYTSVKIVPVNGGMGNHNLTDLQQRLNAIYAPAVAGWNVEIMPNQNLGTAWDTNSDGKLADGETGMLSNYTGEMNNLIGEFRKRHNRSRDTYYVFLVGQPATPGKLGFMPRKKQWGFVFTGNHGNTDALVKTIAHELGHGVYRLEHPFAERGLPRGETDNLMDYANGTALYKYQWDFVHDPARAFTLFDEDEDASLDICFWIKSLWNYNALFGEEHVLTPYMPIYNEVKNNFDNYWEQSRELFAKYRFGNDKVNNLSLATNGNWTVRNASHYKKTDSTFFVDHAILAIVEKSQRGISLHQEGITLARINLKGKDYKLAAYSLEQTVNPTYVRVTELCDLADNQHVQVYNDNGQSFIAFLKNGVPELVIQILTENEDDLEIWLEYLGILVKDETSWEGVVPPFWENWSWEDAIDALNEFLTNEEDDPYRYVVSDERALIRTNQSPFNSKTPEELLLHGMQTIILDTVLNETGKLYGRIVVKSSMDTVVTSLGNLTEVIKIDDKEFTMRRDYTAILLPYSSVSTPVKYPKGKKFIAYKACGDFLKVKGKGSAIEGHWIPKFMAGSDPEFPVTKDQLVQIFPGVDTARISEVLEVINSYSNDFEINTATRMSHFLGQIGGETQLTSLLEESYSANNMLSSSKTRTCRLLNGAYVLKYCDLFTGYNATASDSCPFPFCSSSIEIPTSQTYLEGTVRYVNQSYMSDSLDLSAKSSYTENQPNNPSFFDYVYACQLGNGTNDSHDGRRFRGRGFIQLTGYHNYNAFQKLWNQTYGVSSQKDFICRSAQCDQNLEELNTNMETAMLAAFVYWDARKINGIADAGTSNSNIDAVTLLVNGALHGKTQRRNITTNALTVLNQ